MNDKTVLVTGANGFVGQALCPALARAGWRVRPVSRAPREGFLAVGDIDATTDWRPMLRDVQVVIHLAARVHVMVDQSEDPLAAFRLANCAATENLARQAAAAGVARLVYVSSIKVNGEATSDDRPFRPDDTPHPQDDYGISKWEAEQALHRLSEETGIEIAILRPPLIYGPAVKANFLRLMRLVDRGIPLPRVNNKRSLIYVENFVDALVTCAEHPAAAGQTFLVSDGVPLSTTELARGLAGALGRSARLVPAPAWILRLAGKVTRRQDEVRRLLDSLEVDDSAIRRDLGWRPPCSAAQGFEATARWYRSSTP